MRDPFSWALPIGRVFGITVKVHVLFIIFIVVMWLRPALASKGWEPGSANTMLILLGMVFGSVLLHEFGHCFAARLIDGDADEILLWPLGGLAKCDIPHTPRAQFFTAAGGPAVNLALCILSGSVLASASLVPPLLPLPENAFYTVMWNANDGMRYGSSYAMNAASEFWQVDRQLEYWQVLVGQFFFVNWGLSLLNLVLVGFPLDGGRMLQAALWARTDYHQSMRIAIYIGFCVMLLVGIVGLVANEVLWLCLAGFMYFACRQELWILETGQEESLFGYDFSQGYTSLERDEEEPRPRKKRLNFFQRWLQRRQQLKLQRERERERLEEQRVDELLEKIQRHGRDSLTDEEQRFLKRVADRLRNKR